jgi:Na+-driven multidrug efflux pump
VINVAGNWVLSIFLGVAGIALSTSVVYLASVGMSFAYTRRRLRQLRAGAPPPEAR